MRKNNQDLTIIRFVVFDYFLGIKEGWKRLSGAEVLVWFWDYFWIGILWAPKIYDEAGEAYRPANIWGGAAILVMFLGFLISRMYPGKLEKTLHLCPLTEVEKKQYVKTGYQVRIALPMILYVITGTVGQILGIVSLSSVIWIGIWIFLYLGCANIYCLPEGEKDTFGQRYPIEGLELFLLVTQILALGEIAGMSFFILENSCMIQKRIYIGIITFFQIVLYIIMRKKFYSRTMERAVCYENNN